MRMNNDRDRQFVESTMPEGSKGFLESLPALQNREAILSGEGVAAPMRIRLSYLEEAKRPSSTDPDFATHWRTRAHTANRLLPLLRGACSRWMAHIGCTVLVSAM